VTILEGEDLTDDGSDVASTTSQPVSAFGSVLRVRTAIGDYVALTKPRIIELLLVTTVPVMLLAARGFPSVELLVSTLIGGTLAAGAANALNCYVDRDIDAVMRRTARRPLNRSAMPPRNALTFGLVLGAIAVAQLWVTTNALSAMLALAAIAFYVLIYTMLLKRRTSSNIVWGGAAGCMPVLIGWSAVTGSLAWPPVVLFAVVFLWTPPHFWALAMQFRDDYAAAGVPMLPVVATPIFVVRRMIGYSWAMVAASLLLWPVAHTTPLYPSVALIVGLMFVRETYALRSRIQAGSPARPTRVFRWSINYLSLLFLAVAVDALLH
jgi:protoheme IX farnesyltransferase